VIRGRHAMQDDTVIGAPGGRAVDFAEARGVAD
jgi:hypothetical protein